LQKTNSVEGPRLMKRGDRHVITTALKSGKAQIKKQK
jgi:hypothetical protein